MGLSRPDDAGVYKLTEDIAIIQTVDFFTPVVDDPYMFGQIAAANALSDIYAMGGQPLTAMNIVGFPVHLFELSVLNAILAGGLDKIREAGAVIVGGHTIEDVELKYGLAVTGLIHPAQVKTKGGLQLGDRLILTKPLGTGIITTAIKAGLVSVSTIETVSRSMAMLNKTAAELMRSAPIHACTDITGFGLAGHLSEMLRESPHAVKIRIDTLPCFAEVKSLARQGFVPAGTCRNRQFYQSVLIGAENFDPADIDIIYDAQTSGGLLLALPAAEAAPFVERLHQNGIAAARVVGEVISGPPGKIMLD